MMEDTGASPDTLTISLINGDILTAQADVLVTSVHRSKVMTVSPLASHILRHAGKAVEQELKKVNGSEELEHGQVVTLPSGNLSSKFKELMAICLYSWRPGNDLTLIEEVFECLLLAHSKGFTSVVFPALGMGGLRYPAYNVAMAITAGIVKFKASNQDSPLHTVYIAICDKDKKSVKTFLETTSEFLSGELFKDVLEETEGSAVVVDGMDEFQGLESSKPKTITDDGSKADKMASPITASSPPPTSKPTTRTTKCSSTSGQSAGAAPSPGQPLLQFCKSIFSVFRWSGKVGPFTYNVQPNVSMTNSNIGIRLEVGFDLSHFMGKSSRKKSS